MDGWYRERQRQAAADRVAVPEGARERAQEFVYLPVRMADVEWARNYWVKIEIETVLGTLVLSEMVDALFPPMADSMIGLFRDIPATQNAVMRAFALPRRFMEPREVLHINWKISL